MHSTPKQGDLQARVPATMGEKLAWYTRLVSDENLRDTSKVVASRLMIFHNDKTGQCNPRQARLAQAVGLKLRTVNGAIAELQAGGWITAVIAPDYGGADYVLNLDCSAGKLDDQSEAEDVTHDGAQGVRTAVRRGTHDGAQGVRMTVRTEETREPSTEGVHLTLAPNASEEERLADELEVPEQPVAISPVPANDDQVAIGVVMVSGLAIPAGVHMEWVASFREIDVQAQTVALARWAMTKVPERKRLDAVASALARKNETARRERLDRKETKAAEVAAGIERDIFSGRKKGQQRENRYQIFSPAA